MARWEIFGKTLGCRLVLLLFWTIFVCSVLYTSREKKISDISLKYLKGLSSSRLKRFSSNESQLGQGQCRVDTPSQEDLESLERIFRNTRSRSLGKAHVHCSVVSLCNSDSAFKADCYSSECSAYRVRTKDENHIGHVISSLSAEDLSGIVAVNLNGKNSFMAVDDLNRHMDVYCQDPTVSKLELTGDVIPGRNCKIQKQSRVNTGSKKGRVDLKKNIHLVYFRFLSQREIPLRFPGLFALLKKSAEKKQIAVMNFDKHQATDWGDEETLSLLLQGRLGESKVKDSLLHTLRKAGYCFRLEDLSCSKSRDQQRLVTNLTSAGGITCDGQLLRHREAMLERLCTELELPEGNMTETKLRSLLSSLLSNVHELGGLNDVDSRPALSLSILNTKDFRNSEVLDHVLRNLFLGLLSEKDTEVLILSGVGNPRFLRFDQKTGLQSQASNPALMLLSIGNTSMATYRDAQKLNQSLLTMRDVHHFVNRLVTNEENVHSITNESALSTTKDREDPSSCENLFVRPPFVCLCGEQFVGYENDTLMAGFAALAVGVINAGLQKLPRVSPSQSRSQCAKLYGVSFSDVQVGQHGEKKRILLQLDLAVEFSNDRVFRQVALDLWDTDKMPRVEIQFYTDSFPLPTDQETDHSFKTLCRTGENLDFHTTSETSLLKHLSQERHFGHKGKVLHMHDNCLFMFVRDFGDSVSVEAANVCRDRRYDVMLHLSLMNMMSLSPLPLFVSLGHAQREFMAAFVKVSYTVSTFAYKLHPDFDVSYDD